MLPRDNRLSKTRDFEKVFKEGRSSYCEILGIRYVPNNFDFTRFGFLVSTKISKKAVVRNLIKRRLRAIIREHFLAIKVGYDIVVLTKPETATASFEELSEKLFEVLQRARLLAPVK